MGQITQLVRGMYFSGTGTTEKIVTATADAIANLSENIYRMPDYDFSPPGARQREYSFGLRDIVVFGVPVIAGRVPNVLLPFLQTLEGGGALAIPVVLYGNRNFDDALIELRNILEERGFHTIAGAAFIGEHSFSRILAAGRPDDQDMEIVVDFARGVLDKLDQLHEEATEAAEEIGIPDDTDPEEAALDQLDRILKKAGPVPVDGEEPLRPYYKPRDRQGNHINILKVKPKVDESKCTKCGTCVAACPMGSIKPWAPGVAEGICIKCCGCEKKCPEGAIYFDDEGYLYHKTELELGYPDRKEPKLFF